LIERPCYHSETASYVESDAKGEEVVEEREDKEEKDNVEEAEVVKLLDDVVAEVEGATSST
jgi:hypothetical protein